MKTIYIIRHAKSDWKTGEIDFERGLNERGRAQSKALGQFINKMLAKPDLIISSSAKRTFLSSLNIAHEIKYPITHIQAEKSIYEASYEKYFPVIWGVDNEFNTIVLVGHNPGVSNLVFELTGEYYNFKTSCMAVVTFETNKWENIGNRSGELKQFYAP